MKIFISWSGPLSGEVAQLLKRWLKCVLQATDPWVSSDDIERGSQWFNEISNVLENCNTGIICLTKSNITAPWILFEARNLLKGLETSRVCTFLVDLEPKDIEPPLSQFNHTMPTKESMMKLVTTLNDRLPGDRSLPNETLRSVFDTYWPQFEQELKAILLRAKKGQSAAPVRSKTDMMVEILYAVRNMDNRLKNLEFRILGDDLRSAEPIGDHTKWVDIVVQAMQQLGGKGSLSDIYAECKKILSAGETSKSTNNSIGSTIRRTIYQHSSDVTAYLGKEDLFQQIGSGLWQLRNHERE